MQLPFDNHKWILKWLNSSIKQLHISHNILQSNQYFIILLIYYVFVLIVFGPKKYTKQLCFVYEIIFERFFSLFSSFDFFLYSIPIHSNFSGIKWKFSARNKFPLFYNKSDHGKKSWNSRKNGLFSTVRFIRKMSVPSYKKHIQILWVWHWI